MNGMELIKLELQITRNSFPPLIRIGYEGVLNTIWTFQYHVQGEVAYLKIGRTDKDQRGFVCTCDITGPGNRLYLEYFFGIDDLKKIVIPVIDLSSNSDPLTITCRVIKKGELPLTFGLDVKEKVWTENGTWIFPWDMLEYQKWTIAFRVVFRSENYFYFEFMVVISQEGYLYINSLDKSLADLYIRGEIVFEARKHIFKICLLKKEEQKYLCEFQLPSMRGPKGSPFLSLEYRLFMTTDRSKFLKFNNKLDCINQTHNKEV